VFGRLVRGAYITYKFPAGKLRNAAIPLNTFYAHGNENHGPNPTILFVSSQVSQLPMAVKTAGIPIGTLQAGNVAISYNGIEVMSWSVSVWGSYTGGDPAYSTLYNVVSLAATQQFDTEIVTYWSPVPPPQTGRYVPGTRIVAGSANLFTELAESDLVEGDLYQSDVPNQALQQTFSYAFKRNPEPPYALVPYLFLTGWTYDGFVDPGIDAVFHIECFPTGIGLLDLNPFTYPLWWLPV
jgi:hypothetical protein